MCQIFPVIDNHIVAIPIWDSSANKNVKLLLNNLSCHKTFFYNVLSNNTSS